MEVVRTGGNLLRVAALVRLAGDGSTVSVKLEQLIPLDPVKVTILTTGDIAAVTISGIPPVATDSIAPVAASSDTPSAPDVPGAGAGVLPESYYSALGLRQIGPVSWAVGRSSSSSVGRFSEARKIDGILNSPR